MIWLELRKLKTRMSDAKLVLTSGDNPPSVELQQDFYAMSDKAWELSELQHELALKLEAARRAEFYASISHPTNPKIQSQARVSLNCQAPESITAEFLR